MTNFNKFLEKDEEIVDQLHRHPLVFFKAGLIAIILIALPFFLIFLLFSWQPLGLIIFFILLILGFLALVKLIRLWQFNVLLITDQRLILIKQLSFWQRQVRSIRLKNIDKVSFKFKSKLAKMFNYGSLRITDLSGKSLLVRQVNKPAAWQKFLLSLKR